MRFHLVGGLAARADGRGRISALDDVAISRCRSGKTAALALAYIFAVQRHPYNHHTGFFAGGMPIITRRVSTSATKANFTPRAQQMYAHSLVFLLHRVYFVGLSALAASGLWSAILSVVAIGAVRDRRKHPTCWSALVLRFRDITGSIAPEPDQATTTEPRTLTSQPTFRHSSSQAQAARFREKISLMDFFVIVLVHVTALVSATVWVLDGYLQYSSD